MQKVKKPGSTQPLFIGHGKSLKLNNLSISSPLIYICSKGRAEQFPFAIEKSLPYSFAVAGKKSYERLNYSKLTPQERGKLLRWLASGKSEPDLELHLLLLYQRNLEYRAIVEGRDYKLILMEMLRMHNLYSKNNIYRARSESFISYLLLKIDSFTKKERERLTTFLVTLKWGSIIFSSGSYLKLDNLLPSPLNIYLTMLYFMGPFYKKEVERIGPLFKDYFLERVLQFTNPIERESSLEKEPFHYSYRSFNGPYLSQAHVDGYYLELTKELEERLIELWLRSLKDFSEYIKKAGKAGQGERFLLLPEEIKGVALKELKGQLEKFLLSGKGGLFKAGELADHFGYPYSTHLPSSTSRKLADLLEACGYAIEPDNRSWWRCYRHDQRVIIYPTASPEPPFHLTYQKALYLLKAALYVVEAGGEPAGKRELNLIKSYIRALSPPGDLSNERLERLIELASTGAIEPEKANIRLRESLKIEEIVGTGNFLFTLSTLKGLVGIGSEQTKALKSSCRGLHLGKEFYEPHFDPPIFHNRQGSPIPPDPNEKIIIDENRLKKVITETEQVQETLSLIFSDRANPTEEIATDLKKGNSSPELKESLPAPLKSFLEELLERDYWKKEELRRLALEKKIMLESAVEQINFWWEEETGEWLLSKRYDIYLINKEAMGDMSSTRVY